MGPDAEESVPEGDGEEEDVTDGVEEVERAMEAAIQDMEAESRPVRLILTKVSTILRTIPIWALITVNPVPYPVFPPSTLRCSPTRVFLRHKASKAVVRHQELAHEGTTSMGVNS